MILLAWMLADFITGFVHWFEDKCLPNKSRFKFIQGITEDNIRHHDEPNALCKLSPWQNINTSVMFTLPLGVIMVGLNLPKILYMAVFFASFANLIHMWSHQKKELVPLPIRYIQKTGLFCSQNHHFGHHFYRGKLISKPNASIRYCVMTNWLNPVLDYINFFGTLEMILEINLIKGKK